MRMHSSLMVHLVIYMYTSSKPVTFAYVLLFFWLIRRAVVVCASLFTDTPFVVLTWVIVWQLLHSSP